MTEKTRTLVLAEDRFLHYFNPSWLEQFYLIPWQKGFGKKECLENIAEDQPFSIIFIDNSLEYNRNHFICWLYRLMNGGMLAVESNTRIAPQDIINILSGYVEYIENPNSNVWLFRKKAYNLDYDNFRNNLKNSIHQRDYRKALEHTNLLEIIDPFGITPILIKTKIYHILKLYNVSEQEWDSLIYRQHNPNIAYLKSLDIVAQGDYQRGFKLRMPLLSLKRRTDYFPNEELEKKRWQGENLAGKTFVIWTEFGLGDEIMFIQLAHYFKQTLKVKKLIVITQTPIVSLLKTHPDIDQVIDRKNIKEELGDFDYWVFPHDIMAFADRPFEEIPKRHPYLFADHQSVADKIKPNNKLKVAIVWRGDSNHENDHARSIHNLTYIEQLLKNSQFDWYCVQKICNEEETALLEKYQIPNVAENCQTMLETAAYLKNMDCLVTVDTSVAHLAGALGVKTLLMLPFIVDWRWKYHGTDNVWYPNMQSFRSLTLLPEWDNVIFDILQALEVHRLALNKA
ncbi:hypothetical protein B0187_01265 [Haemophilus paracuniculus]|uniref:Uncharacterized protein n=1 Tax=Haemophilus paracuniculus TaxID=734 RepID=A0A1T0AUS0_9PAST|nr:glycosyltransferase family 9 protein [Haemophilus paracuniculus]OOS00564.1 hypothetical protein B0187_01265 [Haemophilus paracuniculus]